MANPKICCHLPVVYKPIYRQPVDPAVKHKTFKIANLLQYPPGNQDGSTN